MRPEWNELIALPQEEKTPMFNFSIDEIFPWWDEFSEGVDQELLSKSFLIQPDLFLRIRPGQEREVKTKLLGAHLLFNEISHSCLSLENTTQLDNVIEVDREAVIQDYNSQRIAEFLELMPKSTTLSVYDCCAASGGKSILAFDTMDNIQLTVSDLRESILANLKKRFQKAGIRNYQSFVADLSTNFKFQISNFDLIICDAPCTGSGTWSRTPEQLYYFKKEKIDRYSNLQKSILENVVPLIRKGGHLLYITCSVFKKENEDVVEYLQKEFNLKVEKMELLKGYDKKADTLFAALLIA
jgi:16S rRNA (cytosine967-C5)-methyltransferase